MVSGYGRYNSGTNNSTTVSELGRTRWCLSATASTPLPGRANWISQLKGLCIGTTISGGNVDAPMLAKVLQTLQLSSLV